VLLVVVFASHSTAGALITILLLVRWTLLVRVAIPLIRWPRVPLLEALLRIGARTSSNISISVKQSYVEFQISKRGVIYMVGNLKKLYTNFIQNTCKDSIVRLLKNRIQPKLS